MAEIDGANVSHVRRPVIGFCPFGTVGAKKALRRGGRVNYPEALVNINDAGVAEKNKQQQLNSNHNIFVFFDNGTDDFGTELDLRAGFEAAMSTVNQKAHAKHDARGRQASAIFAEETQIHTVLVVVEGGLGTIEGVKNSLCRRIPVVIMEGSGRAADVISYAWRLFHDRDPASRLMSLGSLRKLVRKELCGTGTEERLSELVADVMAMVQSRDQMTIYNAERYADSVQEALKTTPELDHAILLALKSSQRPEVDATHDFPPGLATFKYRLNQHYLYLSLIFNSISDAEVALGQLRSRELIEVQDNVQAQLQDALVWSLQHGRYF